MVYNQNLVAVVKSGGKITRECREKGSNTVYIPFGSEYSILIKNLNTVKALVNIEVDGREVIKGLIVNPNSNVEVERFFGNDMNKGYKLKFIEKTHEIKDFRGDKIDDGIIRIAYQFENPKVTYWYGSTDIRNVLKSNVHGGGILRDDNNFENKYFGGLLNIGPKFYDGGFGPIGSDNIGGSATTFSNNTAHNNSFVDMNQMLNCSVQEPEGITVEGNDSNQSFTYGYIGILESTHHCINIVLKGHYNDKKEVKEPVTVKKKIQCNYCGRKYKSNNRFCPNCGARLL